MIRNRLFCTIRKTSCQGFFGGGEIYNGTQPLCDAQTYACDIQYPIKLHKINKKYKIRPCIQTIEEEIYEILNRQV